MSKYAALYLFQNKVPFVKISDVIALWPHVIQTEYFFPNRCELGDWLLGILGKNIVSKMLHFITSFQIPCNLFG